MSFTNDVIVYFFLFSVTRCCHFAVAAVDWLNGFLSANESYFATNAQRLIVSAVYHNLRGQGRTMPSHSLIPSLEFVLSLSLSLALCIFLSLTLYLFSSLIQSFSLFLCRFVYRSNSNSISLFFSVHLFISLLFLSLSLSICWSLQFQFYLSLSVSICLSRSFYPFVYLSIN